MVQAVEKLRLVSDTQGIVSPDGQGISCVMYPPMGMTNPA